MQKLQKFCLTLATFLSISFSLSACEGFLPFSHKNSSTKESTSVEENLSSPYSKSSSEESGSSSPESITAPENTSDRDSQEHASEFESASDFDSSDENQEENEAWAIVDALYQLSVGEYLEGTYRLTGTITKMPTKKKIIIVIEGRETKPIQCYNLQGNGVASLQIGDVITVSGRLTNYEGIFEFDNGCQLLSANSDAPPLENDPYANITKEEFYANYTRASDNEDAYYRSLHGFISGDLTVPDQAPVLAEKRPKNGDFYIRNEQMIFSEDKNAYTVVNEYGEKAFTIFRSGGYITLEEVAAYVYAFGSYPANHVTQKDPSPQNSIWGEHLRGNHTSFSGNTAKYPYEPKLPNISGCGGTLHYYEMDIGTTGTDCDPIQYPPALYNDGNSIDRGAARIVYGKNDLNHNDIYEIGEFHVFYTYNHYNDFQEYLNYQGGWGEMFGNITGGGKISSKTDYNPTPYISICLAQLPTFASLISKGVSLQNYTALLTA